MSNIDTYYGDIYEYQYETENNDFDLNNTSENPKYENTEYKNSSFRDIYVGYNDEYEQDVHDNFVDVFVGYDKDNLESNLNFNNKKDNIKNYIFNKELGYLGMNVSNEKILSAVNNMNDIPISLKYVLRVSFIDRVNGVATICTDKNSVYEGEVIVSFNTQNNNLRFRPV